MNNRQMPSLPKSSVAKTEEMPSLTPPNNEEEVVMVQPKVEDPLTVLEPPKPKPAFESVAPSGPRPTQAFHAGQIEVVAIRDGFYRRERRAKDDKFRVEKFEDLGSWMRPIDPVIAKKHALNLMNRKKALLNAGRIGIDYDAGH